VVVQFIEALCYKLASHGFDSWPNPLGCSIPGVNSDCNRNKYQEYFLKGGKSGRWIGLTTLPPSCANCLETWEPHLLGTHRACSGIAVFFLSVMCSLGCTAVVPTSLFFPYSLHVFYHPQDETRYLMPHLQSHSIGTVTCQYDAPLHLSTISVPILTQFHDNWMCRTYSMDMTPLHFSLICKRYDVCYSDFYNLQWFAATQYRDFHFM